MHCSFWSAKYLGVLVGLLAFLLIYALSGQALPIENTPRFLLYFAFCLVVPSVFILVSSAIFGLATKKWDTVAAFSSGLLITLALLVALNFIVLRRLPFEVRRLVACLGGSLYVGGPLLLWLLLRILRGEPIDMDWD